MEPEDFADALIRAQHGEDEGFAALYAEFAPAVYGFLRGRIPDEAEDVASSTWFDVARGVHRFEGDAAGFRAWIFTIARRRMINERRRQGRRAVELRPTDTLAPPSAASAEAVTIDGLTGEEAIARVRAVLPELQGEVVLLRVVGGLDVGQIAQILDLAPGHVRVLAHRGLRALADHFSRPPVTEPAAPGISEVP